MSSTKQMNDFLQGGKLRNLTAWLLQATIDLPSLLRFQRLNQGI